jgi:hypothetical protein
MFTPAQATQHKDGKTVYGGSDTGHDLSATPTIPIDHRARFAWHWCVAPVAGISPPPTTDSFVSDRGHVLGQVVTWWTATKAHIAPLRALHNC